MHCPLLLFCIFAWLLQIACPVVASSTYGATLILEIPITSSAVLPEGSQWKTMIQILMRGSGLLNLSYSREGAYPNIVDVYIDFEKATTAQEAQALVTSGAGYTALRSILNGSIVSYVVEFDQSQPVKALDNVGSTELAVFYLEAGATTQDISSFEAAFARLRTAVTSAAGEMFATSGWALGEVSSPALGLEVKTYVALVGWESQASHEAFTTTDAYLTAVEGLLPYLSGDFDSNDKLIPVV